MNATRLENCVGHVDLIIECYMNAGGNDRPGNKTSRIKAKSVTDILEHSTDILLGGFLSQQKVLNL
jgi:hypothetical protein